MDLTSPERSISHSQPGAVVIQTGESSRDIGAGSLLTPAENVAAQQVLATGRQTLLLDIAGKAVGGSFNLSGLGSLSSLSVPGGVTAIHDFASTGGALNIGGDFSNFGRFFGVSTLARVSNASISANNIFNRQDGLLSTVIPAGGLPGFSNLIINLDLSLDAVNDVINEGTIASAGRLNISAGRSIVNGIDGAFARTPLMESASGLNLISINIINHGQIISSGGSINALTSILHNQGEILAPLGGLSVQSINDILNVQNFGGSIVAREAISFDTGAASPNAAITLLGGKLGAASLELSAYGGHVGVDVNEIEGPVFVKGYTAVIGVHAGDLVIAGMDMSGDPIFFNSNPLGGDLTIPVISTAGQDYVALSTGNIIGPAGTIDTSGPPLGNPQGRITMAAGVTFTTGNVACANCAAEFAVTGTNATGGNINLPGVNLLSNRSVNLQARAGTDSVGFVTTGNITTTGRNAVGSGNPGEVAGAITIVAADAIQVGNINAVGGNGSFNGSGTGGAGAAGGVVNISTPAGNVDVGTINTSGGAGGGSTTVSAGAGGAGGGVTLDTDNGDITVSGNITTVGGNGGNGDAGGLGGIGGSIGISPALGNVNLNGTLTTSGGTGGSGTSGQGRNGGAAGALNLGSGAGDLNVTGVVTGVGGNGGSSTTTNAGNGGLGSTLTLTPGSGTYTFASTVTLSGGNAANGDVGGDGGSSGSVSLTGGDVNVIFSGAVATRGGNGGFGNSGSGGAGGSGGAFSLAPVNGNVQLFNVQSGGGTGGGSSTTAAGNGGVGGAIAITIDTGDLDSGLLSAVGGNAGNGDAGGIGGNGGPLTLTTNLGTISLTGDVNSSAGTGGNGTSGSGGLGGSAGAMTLGPLSGNMTVGGSVLALGAMGGTSSTTSAGNGGNGATINFTAGAGTFGITGDLQTTGGNGGNGDAGGVGGLGGTITLNTGDVDLSVGGTIVTSGGAGGTGSSGFGGAGGAGRNFVFTPTTGTLTATSITATGGAGGGSSTTSAGLGGAAGQINLSPGTGDITTTGSVSTRGGQGGSGDIGRLGGAGGALTIRPTNGNVIIGGSLTAAGGNGGSGTSGSGGGGGAGAGLTVGPDLGNLSVTGAVSTDGGTGGTSSSTGAGTGGAGGNISFFAGSGTYSVGSISSSGGSGGNGDSGGGGGGGGTISLLAGDVNLASGGAISSAGGIGGTGSSGNGGNAGNGGAITLTPVNGTVSGGAVSASGGIGGFSVSQTGGFGGTAANINISPGTGNVTLTGSVTASGGNGGGGDTGRLGGNAATITITPTLGDVSVTGSVSAVSGSGGFGNAGNGGAAGATAGTINLGPATGNLLVTVDVTASGGTGGGSSSLTAGIGGASGSINFTSGNGTYTINGTVRAAGGVGGNGDTGNTGGAGGSVQLLGGSVDFTATGGISAIGGTGGNGTSGNGRAGGNGGTITLTPATGNIASGLVTAGGGNGGSGNSGGNGGLGGSVTLTSGDGAISLSSNLVSSGGTGGNASGGTRGQGRNAGNITVNADDNFTVQGFIRAAGGLPGTGGGAAVTGSGGVQNLTGYLILVNGNSGGSSIFSGNGGSITILETAPGSIASPQVYDQDMDLATGTDHVTANIGNVLFTVGVGPPVPGLSGSAGSVVAGGGVTINTIAAGTNVTTGSFGAAGGGSITIDENGAPLVITNGTLVTPAEWIALIQVSNAAPQTMFLDATGNADTNASFTIAAANIPVGNFNNLVLPATVTANATAATVTYTGSANVQGTFNVAANGTLAANSITNTGTIGGTTNVTVRANSIANDGLITSPGAGAAVLVTNNGGNLAVSGTGNITATGGGATTTTISVTGVNQLQINADQTFTPGAGGRAFIDAQTGGGSIVFGNGVTQTVNDGSRLSVRTQSLTFGNGSLLTATGASLIDFSSTGGSLNVFSPDSGSMSVVTTGGITFQPTANGAINFNKTAGAGIATLNLNGSAVNVITNNGAITTTANVALVSDNNLSFNATGGAINANGTANAVNLSYQTAGNTIIFNADQTATTSLSASAGGAGNIARATAGTLIAPTITLQTVTGSIGAADAAGQIYTTTDNLAANAGGATSDVFITETDTVTVAASSAGDEFFITVGAAFSTSQAASISAPRITIASTAVSSGDITINSAFTASNSITLIAGGSGSVLQPGAGGLTAPNISLVSGTGNIGASAVARIQTDSTNLTANTAGAGDVFIDEITGGTSIGASSAGDQFNVVSNGNTTISGLVNAPVSDISTRAGSDGNITLNANVGTGGSTSIFLLADGSGSIVSGGGQLVASSVSLQSTSGNIGVSGNAIQTNTATLTASTGGTGDVFIVEANAVTLSPSQAGDEFDLTIGGNFTIAPGLAVIADDIRFTTTSNGTITINNDLSAPSSVSLTAGGTGNIIRTSGTLISNLVTLASNTGSIGTFAAPIQTNAATVTITAAGATTDAFVRSVSGAAVALGTSASGDELDFRADANLTVSGIVSADRLSLITTNGGNITLSADINPDISALIDADGVGDIVWTAGTISGAATTTFVSDTGNVGSLANPILTSVTGIVANTGGAGAIFIREATAVTLNPGGLTSSSGGNFVLTTLNGALTVSGNIGAGDDLRLDVTGGGLTVNGNLTAANDITVDVDHGSVVASTYNGTINAGGLVTLEGFGDVNVNNTVTVGSLNVISNAGSVQSINLVGNIVATGAVNASGRATIANIGTISGASLNFDSDTSSLAGNIQIGNTVTITGAALLTTSGSMNIASPLSANTVSMQSTAGAGAANIDIDNNVSGTVSVSITTAAGSITQGGGVISGPTITLVSGSGNMGTSAANLIVDAVNLSANAGGGSTDVFITDNNGVTLGGSSAGDQFELTVGADFTLSAASVINADDIAIATTAASNGNIFINGNFTAPGTSLTLAALGNGDVIWLAGTLSGNQINLSSVGGDVGAVGAEVLTNAGTLTGNAPAGNVFLHETDTTVTLGSSTAGVEFSLTVDGNVNTSALSLITAPIITVATTNNGDITVNSDFSAATRITLNAGGAGNLLRTAGTLTSAAGEVVLISATGNIGASGADIRTTTATLSANTGGANVFVNETDAVTINPSSALDEFHLTVGGNFATGGAGSILADDIFITTTSNGSITINNNLSANGSINLVAGGLGDIIDGTGTLISNVVSLSSGTGNIGAAGAAVRTDAGTINVTIGGATGDAFITEVDNVIVSGSVADQLTLNSSGGNFTLNTLTADDLSVTTAANNTITINATVTGTTTVVLNTPGTGSIASSGINRLVGGAITLSSDTGDIGVGGALRTTATSITASTAGDIAISELDGLVVDAFSGNNVSITAGGSITGGVGQLDAVNLVLNASAGSIGTSGTNIVTNTANLTASAGGVGNDVFINEVDGVILGTSTANDRFELTVGGNFSTLAASPITAANIVIQTAAGSGGDILINSNFSATNSIALTADGAGDIAWTAGTLGGPLATLSSTSGNIGVAGNEISVSTTSVSASTSGDVFLSAQNNITLLASNAGGTFDLDSVGTINVSGVLTAPVANLTSGNNANLTISNNIIAATSATISAGGSGNIIGNGGTISAGLLTLSSGTGNIGSSAAHILTDVTDLTANTAAAGSGDVFITETNGVNLGLSSAGDEFELHVGGNFDTPGTVSADTIRFFTTANGNITVSSALSAPIGLTLDAGGSGNIIHNGGSLTSDAVTLVSGSGNIGAAGAGAIRTNAVNLSLTISGGATGDAFVTENDGVSVTGAIADQFTLSTLAAGTVILNTLTSDDITVGTAGNGSISINGTVTGTTSVALTAQGSGNITNTGANRVVGGALTLTSGTGDIGAGAGLLTTATSLTATTGGLGDVTISELNNLDLNNTQGEFITVGAGGTLVVNGAVTATLDVALSGTSGITQNATGTIAGDDVALTSGAGTVSLGANISSVTSTTVTANGSISRAAGTLISTGSVALTSTTGSIGSLASNIETDTNTLTAIANTAGADVFITELSGVTLGSSSANDRFELTVGGDFTTAAATSITAANILIATGAATDGNITINSNLSASGTITLSADGAGDITWTAGILGSSSVVLQSTTGSIGSSGAAIPTTTGSLSANTGGAGDVFVSETNDLIILASTAGDEFNVSAGGNITVSGVVTAPIVSISTTSNDSITLSNDVNGATSVDISANGSGTITRTAGLVTGGDVTFTSGSGTIGTSGAHIQTSATTLAATTSGSADVFITEADAVTINPSQAGDEFDLTVGGDFDVSAGSAINAPTIRVTTTVNGDITIDGDFGASTSLTFNAGGTGVIAHNSGTLTSPTITLSAGGDIGAAGAEVLTDAGALTLSGGGDIFLVETNAVSLLASTAADELHLQAAGTITVNGAVLADDLDLSTSAANGAITISANITGTSTVNLAANGSGSITRTAANRVIGAAVTLASGTGDIGTGALNLLTAATSITATTAGTGDIQISELDALTLNNISSLDAVSISAGNNMTVSGTVAGATVALITNAGSVTLDNSVTAGSTLSISANDSIVRNAGTLNATGTTLTATNGDIGAAAAASHVFTDTGSLTAIALAAGGDIFITETNALTLNSSSANDRLEIIAGADLSTAAASNITGNRVVFNTIAAGDITLNGNVTGTTSVVINADTTGSITRTAGTITSTALTLISGTGDIGASAATALSLDVGSVSANTAGAGNVFLSELNAVTLLTSTAGNSFSLVAGGVLTAGDVGATSVTLRSSGAGVTLGGIVSGTTAVTIQSAGTGDITMTAGSVNGALVTLSAATGNIGSAANNIFTAATTLAANTGGGGDVFINELDLVTVNASAAGDDFQLTVGGDFSTAAAGNISANDIAIFTTSNGDITVNSNFTAATGNITLGAGGTGDIIRTAGALTAGSITLSSVSGDIGSAGPGAIATTTGSLTAVTGGDVFVAETNALSIGASSAGGVLQISAGGTITTTGVLTSNDLVLTTTAANGGLVFGADATGTTSVSLITVGTGTITQGSGRVIGGALAITTGTGNTTLNTDVASLVVANGNTVTINELDAITLNNITAANLSVTAGGALNTTVAIATGNLTLAGSGAGLSLGNSVTGSNVVLTASAGGNISQGAGVVSGTNLTVNLGTGAATLNTNIGSLFVTSAAGSTVTINDSAALILDTMNAGAVNVTANGNITTGGTIVTTDLILQTTASSNGNIALSNNVTGTMSVILDPGGSGTITQSSGRIFGGALQLLPGSGVVNVDTDVASVAVSGPSDVTINESNNITILASTSVGFFRLVTTAGSIATNSVSSATDSLTLIANGGGVTVLPASLLSSNGGDMSLTSSGAMLVQNGSDLNVTNADMSLRSTAGSLTVEANTDFTATGDIDVVARNAMNIGTVGGAAVTFNSGGLNGGFTACCAILPIGSVSSTGSILLDNFSLGGNQDLIIGDNVALTSRGGNGVSPTAGSVGIHSAVDIIIGDGVNLAAAGGDVWLSAADDVTIGNGATITSVAKLYDNGSMRFIPAANNSVPNYVGGRIAIFAGAPTTNLPVLLNTRVGARDGLNVPILPSPAQFDQVTNTINLTNGGYMDVSLASGTDKTGINTSIFNSDGGVLMIDPPDPGNSVTFSGASFLAFGPAVTNIPPIPPGPPPAPPVAPVVPAPPATIGPPGVLLVNPTLPNPSTVIPLDTISVSAGVDETPVNKNRNDVIGLPKGDSPQFVVSFSCHPMVLESDRFSVLVGDDGTTFSADDSVVQKNVFLASAGSGAKLNGLKLKEGKLMILAGKEGVVVETAQGDVLIPAGTSAVVQQTNNLVRVSNLDGSDAQLAVTKNGTTEHLSASSGQELVIADDSLADEELIPIDGVDREIISAGTLSFAGNVKAKTRKSNFDKKQMADKQTTLMCDTKYFEYPVPSRIKQLKEKMQASNTQAAKPLKSSSDHLTPIAYSQIAPGKAAPANLTNISDAYGVIKQYGNPTASFERANTVRIDRGEALIVASQPLSIKSNGRLVHLKPGAVVLVNAESGNLKLFNLCESSASSVTVSAGKNEIDLPLGSELSILSKRSGATSQIPKDNIGRRRVLMTDTPDAKIITSEISIASAIPARDVLLSLFKSADGFDQQLAKRISKTTVALLMVTGSHGSYSLPSK